MVRKGFYIGKRILSAFPRYARLVSHEQAVEKDSYASLRDVVGLWRMAYSVWFVCSNYMLSAISHMRGTRASPLRSF
jgi:hypothetical protein